MEMMQQFNSSEDESDTDSMFGSFNPNLNTKYYDEDSHDEENQMNEKVKSFDNFSKFTTKTSSFNKGLLLLEKAPDESLLNKTYKP
jgi:hypothetical protein